MKTKYMQVKGFVISGSGMKQCSLTVSVTNNEHGKTISVSDGITQFTLAAEEISEHLN